MRKTIFRKRNAFYLLILAGIPVMLFVPPVIPILQLAPENVRHIATFRPPIGDFYLTNTLIALAIVDVLMIALGLQLGLAHRRAARASTAEDRTPKGFHNMIEALIEFFFNQTEDTAGAKWASSIFPLVMTIIIMVVLANWMELVPGVDSIGILEPSPTGEGFAPVKLTNRIGPVPPIYYLDRKTPQTVEVEEGVHHGEVCQEACAVLPYVRVPSTDLNFTLALALVSVGMTQLIGFRALGIRYLGKFFVFNTLFTNPMGFMDMFVGLLELLSEIIKILSFSFRLLGNIFAGTILLFVVSFFVAPFVPWIIAFLELFVGAIQAYVFGMLTLTFMSGATVHHGPGDEH